MLIFNIPTFNFELQSIFSLFILCIVKFLSLKHQIIINKVHITVSLLTVCGINGTFTQNLYIIYT